MQRDSVSIDRTLDQESTSPPGTLDRGLAILQLLATRGSASAAEVAQSLQTSRSTAYRLLSTLQEYGYVEPAELPSQLRLGIKAAEIGMAAIASVDVTRIAPPYLRELVAQASETAFLAIVDDHAVVYMHREPGPNGVQMSARLGSRRPLYCTALGKAYLSALPDDAREAIVRELDLRGFTANTIVDYEALLEELERTRERGYAIDNVEGEAGVGCFGAPILNYSGLPIAAISVAGPADRILPNQERTGPQVRQTAAAISRRLGAPT